MRCTKNVFDIIAKSETRIAKLLSLLNNLNLNNYSFSCTPTEICAGGAFHKGYPHIRGRWVMQKWTNADRGKGWLVKCVRPLGKKIMATIFVKFTQINEIFFFPDNDFGTLAFLLGQSCLCVTFTSWSTPSFGMLLSKLSNRNTHVCISSIKMISFFYPSVWTVHKLQCFK